MSSTLRRDELGASHRGAVALAVPGLEDARVSALPRREARSDLLEQLVRRRTMWDFPACEAAVMERTGPRLRDQLLHERTELLGFRLGGLDGATLDQRFCQVF